MKYLIFFKPDEMLSNLIKDQEQTTLRSAGIKTTLCTFKISEAFEDNLMYDLFRIKFESFEVETIKFDQFAEDSLVLRLSTPSELERLHENILSVARKYDSNLDETYFGQNYNPHITFSNTSKFNTDSTNLLNQSFRVDQYFLARRTNENWVEIDSFPSILTL